MAKEIFEKFKKDICENCNDRAKCEGLSITLDNKAKCIKKNIVE